MKLTVKIFLVKVREKVKGNNALKMLKKTNKGQNQVVAII